MSSHRESDLKIRRVDCRDLQPPEPLVKVLEEVETLEEGEAVLMIHRQMPKLLFPELSERGLAWEVTKQEHGEVEILIWKEKK